MPSRCLGLVAVLAIVACGDDSPAGTTPVESSVPTTLSITPETIVFTAVADTARFTAEVRDQNGRVVTAAVTWTSSEPAVASVNGSGLARAVADGTTTITAVAGSAADSAGVTVRREVAGVAVSPAAVDLEVGDTLRLMAETRDRNGYQIGDQAMVTWTSEDEYVATIDATGLVRARVRGSATIIAALDTLTGNADVTVTLPPIPPNLAVDEGTSHSLQFAGVHVSHVAITGRHQYWNPAFAYADFNGDGHLDIFYSPHDGSVDPMPAEIYIGDGGGGFDLQSGFLGDHPPAGVHPRKALPGDFNGDGKPDIFVVDHGYDHPPWPGAPPYALLSSGTGYVAAKGLDNVIGYHHGGASADIDADGDLDIVAGGGATGPYFFINDGAGAFTWDTTRVDIGGGVFTLELVDVDSDGYVDLLTGDESAPPQILWGNATGLFSLTMSTTLAAVPGHGWTVDLDAADLDGDGDKDIVVNRTGDESGPGFYHGYYLQLLEQTAARAFADVTLERVRGHRDDEAQWISWIRVFDLDGDGDLDVFADEASRELVWWNNGTGGISPIH